jgi:hypothetical protein
VDLRGHGRSDKPEGSYAMRVFADEAQPRSDMSRFHEMFPGILYARLWARATSASWKFSSRSVP